MAKTRIKTTPTRMQKDALMASTATVAAITKPGTTVCHIAAPLDDVKKRLRHSAVLSKPPQSGTSTIIVTAPKRTNSISSVTSTISQISDAHSDTESPPPQTMLSTSGTTTTATKSIKPLLTSYASSQAPRTLNSSLCKPTTSMPALRNRKVFMITEKSDEPAGTETSTSAVAGGAACGQKRKMYLIMEENSCPDEEDSNEGGLIAKDAHKYLKRENGLIVGASGSKKLTLFADKADSGALTEKFEKILPEILHRIQTKDAASVGPGLASVASTPTPTAMPTTAISKLLNGAANLNIIKTESLQPQQQQQYQPQEQYLIKKATEDTNERLPITLPPKKNRTKIITTHINNTSYNGNGNGTSLVNNFSDSYTNNTESIWGNFSNISSSSGSSSNHSNHKIATQCQIKQISAATPVIVSAGTAAARNNNHSSNSSVNDMKRFAAINTNNNSGNTNIRYASNCNGQAVTSIAQVELVPHKNINLSTDFHFLIKMLPKLESIPEPHKNSVKDCIEKIITQNANIFAKQ
ncbi:dr1-associated corepressor homolog [Anastrepha ludens]|uniref:dr1-associated corepressor homolog n=1 Tax=Anastrepha ludens TaxID=28586 RepID=UPI0023B1FAC7|nr:dr1-associated corepressor homolog [Anastrepha ludens]XP_053953665.1 dr1-associated corepressor homolog [Anastrepha ludens]XP_053953666.1 dr1-associated corepressor homolog [Anastrepha ludens]